MRISEKQNRHTIAGILDEKRLDRDWDHWRNVLEEVTAKDVEDALAGQAGVYSLDKLAALTSPAAAGYLEPMAQMARELTIQRFGRVIKLYAPLYLSSFCCNSCKYCGFNTQTHFERCRLTIEQGEKEADIIASEGFRDLLLVSSEDPKYINVEYLSELSRRLRNKFSSISIEINQQSREDYARLFQAGIDGVTIYQETYNRQVYDGYHPAGPKADYDRRLTAADDVCAAGMREIGLGALLGLADWRIETLALAEHAHHLMKRYWQSHVSFSFPRLRPAFDVDRDRFPHLLGDADLVQMLLALRLCFADAGMVISTRESGRLRDNLVSMGITKMSAGSKTNPGGYSEEGKSTGQFEIDDKRTPQEVSAMIADKGFEPVWKDWDAGFMADQQGSIR